MPRTPNLPPFVQTARGRAEWRRLHAVHPNIDAAAAETYIRAYDQHAAVVDELDAFMAQDGVSYVILTQAGELKPQPLIELEIKLRTSLVATQRAAGIWIRADESSPVADTPILSLHRHTAGS